MVTSRDVAKVAGVSQATVSRVLAGSSAVTGSTKGRVLAAIQATGYVPDVRARAMKTSRSGNVGVVVADLKNPYYPEILEELDRSLSRHGLRMSVWVSHHRTEGPDSESAALRAIRSRSVDGVIFTSITPELAELREALDLGSPVVLLNRKAHGLHVDAVVSDNLRGGELLTHLLLDHGRDHPAFIGGAPTASTSSDRLEGYSAALRARGRPVLESRIVLGTYSYNFGFTAMERLLQVDPLVDGVVCSNDILAFGALDAARSMGHAVPEALWVVGFDDVQMSDWRAFDLTTVAIDMEQLAEDATRLLLQRLDHPGRAPETVTLSPELVVRGSAPFLI